MCWMPSGVCFRFLSTPSARRATVDSVIIIYRSAIFLSTPSARRATLNVLPEFKADAVFLSTPSARRATRLSGFPTSWRNYFYPRPPRGGRRCPSASGAREGSISIHALREEGDFIRLASTTSHRDFYPRPPRGGRHPSHPPHLPLPAISIHALREEGD